MIEDENKILYHTVFVKLFSVLVGGEPWQRWKVWAPTASRWSFIQGEPDFSIWHESPPRPYRMRWNFLHQEALILTLDEAKTGALILNAFSIQFHLPERPSSDLSNMVNFFTSDFST